MNDFLIYTAVILGVIVVAQIMRVFELTSKLSGAKEWEVSDKENKSLSTGLVIFFLALFASFIWLYVAYGENILTIPASEHGESVDTLLWFNFAIIITVFVITHIILMAFVYMYRGRTGRKADFVTHNNKLELIWTTTPAVVLAIIIIYGITTWNNIMGATTPEDGQEVVNVELYAKQFDWTARYGGADNELGEFNYRMISTTNPLGVITNATIDQKLAEYNEQIAKFEAKKAEAIEGGKIQEDMDEEIRKIQKHIAKIQDYKNKSASNPYTSGNDDILVKVEFHIPVGKLINFQIRSQDVIHSAFMPHFRAQMNAVPGMVTKFAFTPTKTTAEMRDLKKDPDFNYLLYCNKICGAAHYNMQMTIVVDSEADYKKWLAEQKTFGSTVTAELPAAEGDNTTILASK